MQYFTFELDADIQKLCVISTPFGLYKYKRLPMGVKQSYDIAQEVMENLFRDLDNIEVYIDDIGCFSSSFSTYTNTLDIILTQLEQNGFTVNPSKCEWVVQETDWLGYWLTPTGLKPWSKMIKAITAMQAPVNIKQVCSFIGAVTYYQDMWLCRSLILAPLTDLTGKGTFNWTPVHQKAFDAMKALMVEDVLLCYPDHNLPFQIHTDASDYQLGSVILQQNIPVAFYSHKPSSTQQNYTTIE
jgi:RNase H-like domain found in reverse transcriptase/Reverse transcriptase (RNA-dependent DNA polymerase)